MNKSLIIGLSLIFAFAIFTLLIMTVDLQPIGPEGTYVGFATINGAVERKIGYNNTLYLITEFVGNLVVGTAFYFTAVGAIQLFTRKSFLKVDPQLYVIGGMYILALLLYLVFDKLGVNYRPHISGGEELLEPSYPSSHTLLCLTFAPAGVILAPRYIKHRRVLFAFETTVSALALFVIIGRMLSGAHWFTDIVGSVLLGGGLIALYYALIDYFSYNE